MPTQAATYAATAPINILSPKQTSSSDSNKVSSSSPAKVIKIDVYFTIS